MKKIFIALVIVLGIAIFAAPTVKSAILYYLPTSSTGVASTTSSFIIGGTGTSTMTFSSDGYEQVSYLVAFASSTTPPTLCWKHQYSINGTDWYNTDQATSTYSHNAVENRECWTYATTSASEIISRGTDGKTLFIGRKIVVPNLDTTWTRTIFNIEPGVNARLDIRRSLKNTVITTK